MVKVYAPGPSPESENGVVDVKVLTEFAANKSLPTIVPPDKYTLAALSEAKEPDRSDSELRVKFVE